MNPRKPVAGALNCKLLKLAAFEVFSGSDPGAVGVIVMVLVLVLVLVLLLLVSAISTLTQNNMPATKSKNMYIPLADEKDVVLAALVDVLVLVLVL